MSKTKHKEVSVLIDGDVFVYRAAWACNEESLQEAEGVLSGLLTASVEAVLGYSDMEKVKVYLTGKGNYRHDYLDDYKGNRTDSIRPVHVEDLRDYLLKWWKAEMSSGEEADDLIAMEATRQTKLGNEVVVVSIDKDMLQIPCWHYNPVKQSWTKVDETAGLRSFYKQMLIGDRVDNVRGVDNIGPVKAAAAIDHLTTEKEMLDTVRKFYNGDEKRLVANGIALWLRREPEQIWSPPNA